MNINEILGGIRNTKDIFQMQGLTWGLNLGLANMGNEHTWTICHVHLILAAIPLTNCQPIQVIGNMICRTRVGVPSRVDWIWSSDGRSINLIIFGLVWMIKSVDTSAPHYLLCRKPGLWVCFHDFVDCCCTIHHCSNGCCCTGFNNHRIPDDHDLVRDFGCFDSLMM